MFVALSIWRDQAENSAFMRAAAELSRKMPERRWKWGGARFYVMLLVGDSWDDQEALISSLATEFREELASLVAVGARVEFEVATGDPIHGPYTLRMPVSPSTISALGAAGVGLNTAVVGVHKPMRTERIAGHRRWRGNGVR